jgi:hypothetical protein
MAIVGLVDWLGPRGPVEGVRGPGNEGANRRRWTQQLSMLYAEDLKLACIVVPADALQWQLSGCAKKILKHLSVFVLLEGSRCAIKSAPASC